MRSQCRLFFPYALSTLFALHSIRCGDELIGNKEDFTVLKTLKVELLPPFEDVRPSKPMRVGVLWLSSSSPDAWCSLHASASLGLPPSTGFGAGQQEEIALDSELQMLTQELCRDPLGVSPELAGESVVVPKEVLNKGGSIEIPFTRLPSAEVLFGSPDARVGYATIVLFEDLNEDGALTLGEARRWRGGGRGGDGEEGKMGSSAPDRVWGASFQSIIQPHQRLVYHEGAQIDHPFFYPTIGCEALPKGFGVIKSKAEIYDILALFAPYLAEDKEFTNQADPIISPELCEVFTLETAIQIQVEAPSSRLQELVCQPLEDEGEEPPEREPKDLMLSCVSPTEVLAVDQEAECKAVQYWRLVGCPLNEVDCEEPRWDMRSNVPQWWPCTEERP